MRLCRQDRFERTVLIICRLVIEILLRLLQIQILPSLIWPCSLLINRGIIVDAAIIGLLCLRISVLHIRQIHISKDHALLLYTF